MCISNLGINLCKYMQKVLNDFIFGMFLRLYLFAVKLDSTEYYQSLFYSKFGESSLQTNLLTQS